MTQPLLSARQVAARLNVTAGWFYRHHSDLEARGFPKGLPGFKRGRWSAEAIETWIVRESGVSPEPAADSTPETVEQMQLRVRDIVRARGHKIARRQMGRT